MAYNSFDHKTDSGSSKLMDPLSVAGIVIRGSDSSQHNLVSSTGKNSLVHLDYALTQDGHEDQVKQSDKKSEKAITSDVKNSPNSHGIHKKTDGCDSENVDFNTLGHQPQDGEAHPLISGRTPRHGSRMCNRTNFFIYLSHFLSAWGDNMWTFAVGVFLVEIDGDSLQLTATFGLTMGISTLLLGPIIGDWVDNMPRLRAAQEALVLQNVMIALCAGFIYNLLEYEPEIKGWGEWAPIAHYALIIFLGSGAYLAHIANTIAIERDWVVEICAQDEDKLASMTATMRAIDLTAMIVAPIVTGQIMTLFSSKIGALFIAGWNVASFFLEYLLLLKVYNSVLALQKEKDFSGGSSEEKKGLLTSQSRLGESMARSDSSGVSSGTPTLMKNQVETNVKEKCETQNQQVTVKAHPSRERKGHTCLQRLKRLFSGVTIIAAGWKTYARYKIALSGISLALLYMTVLGFDNVTIGYAKMQCLSEFEVGLMMGGAGLVGTFGTFMYPVLRRCLGLPWTGMVALTLQSATLSMCVVSVWLPGSPFDLDNPDRAGMACEANSTHTNFNATVGQHVDTILTSEPRHTEEKNLTSVAVLMAGIIAARFGLWIADLAITQMFLETVVESERGIVNGVQQSLNQFLDLIKFMLVIILPRTSQFGLLVVFSYAFVFSGWLLYLVFLVRVPKQLFVRKVSLDV